MLITLVSRYLSFRSSIPQDLLDLDNTNTNSNAPSNLSNAAFNSLLNSVHYTKIGYSNFADNFSTVKVTMWKW